MALKKGLCHNYGECGLADSREIQEKDSTEFVCEECGKALQEVGGEKKGGKKANKRGLLLILAALLLIGIIVAVCILLFHKSEPPTLALNKSNCELVVGENDTLYALISPDDNEFEVKWLSDNENVVMASTSGIVKAVGEGEANITAVIKTKKEEIQAVCHYIVLPLPVDTDTVAMVDFTNLSFVREKIEATVGDTVQLSLLKEPATGNEDVEWSSSDEAVATVDASGLWRRTSRSRGQIKPYRTQCFHAHNGQEKPCSQERQYRWQRQRQEGFGLRHLRGTAVERTAARQRDYVFQDEPCDSRHRECHCRSW